MNMPFVPGTMNIPGTINVHIQCHVICLYIGILNPVIVTFSAILFHTKIGPRWKRYWENSTITEKSKKNAKTTDQTFSIYQPHPFANKETIIILYIRLYMSLTLRPFRRIISTIGTFSECVQNFTFANVSLSGRYVTRVWTMRLG